MRLLPLTCVLSTLLVVGCGGGSSSSSNANSGASLALAMSPGNHADLNDVQAGLDSVELVDASGRSTGNLLAAGARLPVVTENPDAAFLPLRAPAEGQYTECVLRYSTGAQSARLRDGTPVPLEVEQQEVRFPIGGGGLHHRAGQTSWLSLRHRADVDAWEDAPRHWKWHPRLDSDAGTGLFFHDARVRVQSIVSKTEFRFGGVFDCGCGPIKAEFVVAAGAIVIAEHQGPLTREALFAQLQPGMVVKVLGRLGVDGAIQVQHLVLRQHAPNPDEVVVLAEITDLNRTARTADIVIVSVRKGQEFVDAFLGGATDRRIGIALGDADVRRSGGEHEIELRDLAVGQRVEVTFPHFPVAEPMPVSAVALESDLAEIEGQVGDASGLPAFFTLAPRQDVPLFRRGCVNGTVRVNLAPATRIYRNGSEQSLGVGDLTVGTRVRVRGTLVSPGVLSATSVRVRVEHGRGEH